MAILPNCSKKTIVNVEGHGEVRIPKERSYCQPVTADLSSLTLLERLQGLAEIKCLALDSPLGDDKAFIHKVFMFSILKKCLLFSLYLRDREKEKKERCVSTMLVYAPNVCNNRQIWICARSRQDRGSQSRSPTWLLGLQYLGHPSCCLQSMQRRKLESMLEHRLAPLESLFSIQASLNDFTLIINHSIII